MNPDESQTPREIDKSLETIPEYAANVESPESPLGEIVTDDQAVDAIPSEISDSETEESIELQQNAPSAPVELRLSELQEQEASLKQEIANLQAAYKSLQTQLNETQNSLSKLVQDSLTHLEQRKQTLQVAVEELERRQERIRKEMRTTFAGASQDLAIRVQGFKDYLTGSLQDLAAAAEQLQLMPSKPESEMAVVIKEVKAAPEERDILQAPNQFQDTSSKIRRIIEQYRTRPDYYGPPWQLRRTFEPIHAERLSNWFFNQGGRGALRAMSSRLQNILVASAGISILHNLYGDRLRTLVLANTPERLGEWRRGLQDCLGIGRADFGPDRGIVLFETTEALAQKAERLVKGNQMPLIVIDDSEDRISLAILQFPLWLAFAPDPRTMRNYDDGF